uniref:Integrase core domain containing protein n=1 Tax=Solanum tuberosum TaxID=4113 RepID=M1D8E5_SOLTU
MNLIKDMMQKMMKRFDTTDENMKEMRNDLSGIGQKVDAHTVSIKQLEHQFSQLSTTVNPRQLDTLRSNTIQNPKNDGHCMAVTTGGGKWNIVPPMPSEVERVVEKYADEIEVTGESKDATEKDSKLTQKVIPMLRHPPPFPQRLGKKTEEGKYRSDCIAEYDELVDALDRFEFRFKPESTNESPIGTIASKQAPTYSRNGKSKSVAPLIDEESDHVFIP